MPDTLGKEDDFDPMTLTFKTIVSANTAEGLSIVSSTDTDPYPYETIKKYNKKEKKPAFFSLIQNIISNCKKLFYVIFLSKKADLTKQVRVTSLFLTGDIHFGL